MNDAERYRLALRMRDAVIEALRPHLGAVLTAELIIERANNIATGLASMCDPGLPERPDPATEDDRRIT